MKTYSYIVLPFNGPRLWPTINGEPTNPSVMRRASCRPNKKGNKSNDEPCSSNVILRNLTIVQCINYNIFGQNSRTYKGKIAANQKLLKVSNITKNQNKTSIQKTPIILTQGSHVLQTQKSTSLNM